MLQLPADGETCAHSLKALHNILGGANQHEGSEFCGEDTCIAGTSQSGGVLLVCRKGI